MLADVNIIKPGDLYSEKRINTNYNRFSSLRVFNNVGIEMTPVDSNTVDCHISLGQGKVKGVKVNLEASTNSNSLFGISPAISFYNKNIFRGGEWLSLGFSGNFQRQFGTDIQAHEFGVTGSLSFPRFVGLPYSAFKGASIPRTVLQTSFNYQNRPEFKRYIGTASFGYSGSSDRIFYQLQELAVKSPFTFRNLTDYAKQLSAFSVPMNEIYDTTKRLADVSAGLGVDMSRIILAYGQIRSASFLRGQEVRQLTEAGIPVLQELSKQFKEIEGEAVSVGKVFDKISARQVPFEMIERMFKDLTSEGGKFYEMQETLAETVKGKVSNLQDAWEIMLSKVGEDNSGFIKGVLDGVTNLIKNYRELAKAIELAAVAYGTYRAAALAAAQAESMQRIIHLATGKNIKAIPALLTKVGIGLKNIPGSIAGIVSKLNPWAIGIAAVTTAVAALIIRYREMNRHLRETDKVTGEAIAKAESSKSNIQYYINQMKAAKEGTEEYNKARQAVINSSGSYISATDAERLSLQNVDDVWVNICKHIEEATKLQAMQSVTANAEASRNEKQLKIIDEVISFQKKNNLTAGEYNFVMDYIKGYKTYEDLYYNPVSRKGRLFQNAVAWRNDWEEAQRIYEETIEHGKKRLSSLYGTGEPAQAGSPEPLTGWRLRAQQYLDTFNGKTRGVKISEETNLADLAESGAKSLNELRKALDLIPKTEADYQAVERDIKFWEQLSEAIYGAGNTEFNNSTKLTKQQIKDAEALRKEQIQAIKQSVQDLKEAKRWYDQLTPLLGSDNARALLASFNFAVPKEGFGAAFQGYADQLKALKDENGARDVMNWANGREIGDVVEAAKAVEKYTEALKDLEAQTKRLNLSGFAQELDKIIVDADSKNRQLETNWAQKAEELEKAKGGWIQRYRVENEKATAEDAEKAWKAFYDKQVAMAKKSIDTQREYNNKVAQEQINDKASKWLEEMMKENNIDFHDMGDKSLEQVNILISRMEEIVSNEALANLIPQELKDDAALINAEFSKLLSTIKKIANTKIGDLNVEKMKKGLEKIRGYMSVLGVSADTSAISETFATLSQALTEVANAQEDVNSAMDEMDKAQTEGNAKDLQKAIDNLAKAEENLANKTEEADAAQVKFNEAIVVAGVGTFASMLGKVAEQMKKVADATGDTGLSDAASAISAISETLSSAAAGYQATGSWIGAVVGAGLDILKQIADATAKAEKKANDFLRTLRNIRYEVAQLRVDDSLSNWTETIFGEDALQKIRNAADVMQEARDRLLQLAQPLSARDRERIFGRGASISTRPRGNFSTDYNPADINIVTDHSFWDGDTIMSLGQIAKRFNMDLYDKNGFINPELLKKVKELYGDLNGQVIDILEKERLAAESYEEAMKQMADGLKAIFGEVGDSIADSLISAFEETGQAAFDMGDILSSVARSFVKDWTKAFLMKNYLNGLSDEITKVFSDNELSAEDQISQAMNLFRDTLAAMGDKIPVIQKFLEETDDQWNWANGAGEELGDAIKTAMVEQNSSLIAGYINSMRADLSMQRNEIMRSISPAVTSISNGFNTHLQYMESVAGNVANIWNRLNLLTSSGSGVKINTRI